MAEGETPPSLPSENHIGKGTTGAITFAVGTLVAYGANHLADKGQRELLTNLAPAIGGATAFIFSRLARQYYHWRGNEMLKEWIVDLLAERPKATRPRQAVIDAEVAEYRARLKQRRLDNLP
jgi:hypothetical protein